MPRAAISATTCAALLAAAPSASLPKYTCTSRPCKRQRRMRRAQFARLRRLYEGTAVAAGIGNTTLRWLPSRAFTARLRSSPSPPGEEHARVLADRKGTRPIRDAEDESVLRFEPALGLDRGHAAGAGGGDGLAVDLVLNVAAGEDAFDASARRAGVGEDVAGCACG
jgi:hypothetical protein